MPTARSGEERRWWRVSLAYLALLYLSLWPLQFALDFLRARHLLRWSIGAVFALAAAAVVVGLFRRRARVREWLVLGAVGVVYVLIASRMPIIQERLHLAEYGLLALLFRSALTARFSAHGAGPTRGVAVSSMALALTAASGLVDELIQGLLPNRQYDLRDVGFNALAGALALAAAAALAGARAADARARKGGEWKPA